MQPDLRFDGFTRGADGIGLIALDFASLVVQPAHAFGGDTSQRQRCSPRLSTENITP
jgi:hypothetical protein